VPLRITASHLPGGLPLSFMEPGIAVVHMSVFQRSAQVLYAFQLRDIRHEPSVAAPQTKKSPRGAPGLNNAPSRLTRICGRREGVSPIAISLLAGALNFGSVMGTSFAAATLLARRHGSYPGKLLLTASGVAGRGAGNPHAQRDYRNRAPRCVRQLTQKIPSGVILRSRQRLRHCPIQTGRGRYKIGAPLLSLGFRTRQFLWPGCGKVLALLRRAFFFGTSASLPGPTRRRLVGAAIANPAFPA
jgi:hypothetical protein